MSGLTWWRDYLQVVEHAEGRHAGGRRSEEALQDGAGTELLLVVLLGGQGGGL